MQAAGFADPSHLTASHIVRRHSEQGVKLLANLLPFVKPGELLHGEMPHQVFRTYWPMASAASFKAAPMGPQPPSSVLAANAPIAPRAAPVAA